jgi:hypothetical protein
MHDVKVVAQAALKVLYVSLASLIGLGIYAWFGGWKPSFLRGLSRGGWLYRVDRGSRHFRRDKFLGLASPAFTRYFRWRHVVVRLFGYLIRLFPIRFWQDVFIFVLGFALLGGLLLGLFAKPRGPKGMP